MIFKDLVAFQTIFLLAASNGKTEKIGRCYVCVPNAGPNVAEVTQMFSDGPPVLSCDRFRPEKRYERMCPSAAYVGCLTQTDGTRITKTCSDVDVQDCKTANKIKYCYCKGELCNGEGVLSMTERADRSEQLGDDEDSPSEGSGFSSSGNRETHSGEESSEPTLEEPLREEGSLTTKESPTIRPSKIGPSSRGGRLLPAKYIYFLGSVYVCILNIKRMGLL